MKQLHIWIVYVGKSQPELSSMSVSIKDTKDLERFFANYYAFTEGYSIEAIGENVTARVKRQYKGGVFTNVERFKLIG